MDKFKKLLAYLGILAVAIIVVYAVVYYAGLSINQGTIITEELTELTENGEVVQIDNTSLIIKTFFDEQVAFTVNGETVIQKMEPINRVLMTTDVEGIEAGETVGVAYRTEGDVNIAERVSAYPPIYVYGEVTEVNDGGVLVTSAFGDYQVNVSNETEIIRVIQGGSMVYGVDIAELEVGDNLDITSGYDVDRGAMSFTAESIRIINY